MGVFDAAKVVNELVKTVHLLQERHERYEKTLAELRNENVELRKEVAGLTTRVAVLEEGRKTTAAEVKQVMTETLSIWKLQQQEEQIKSLKAEVKRLPGITDEG